MKNRIFNLIIIDESGSMFSIKQQAISGLNETIQTIRKAQADHPDQEHFVSLVSFNTESIKTIHNCIPASEIKEIDAFYELNEFGQEEAMQRIIELTFLPQFSKDEVPSEWEDYVAGYLRDRFPTKYPPINEAEDD